MSSVVRAALVYVFLLLLFRLSGKRTLASITTFDLVLTLVISECVQQALVGDDGSLTHGFLLVLTLTAIDVFLSVLKRRRAKLRAVLDGKALILVRDGEPRAEALHQERVDLDDVLSAARERRGVIALDDVDLAVLEEGGGISVSARRDRAMRPE
ncbi:MAG TPA: YetF domain-containing protein [Planctomycetota bacterium]|nr:YetF domain-containing protein [Planctomycetota bacterium]